MAPSVLVSGGGIAGPVLAFWLRRAGYTCTIVERPPVARTTGQQVDVRGAALEVVEKMGLGDAVRSRRVKEHGLAVVDSAGKHVGEFPQRAGGGGASFTSEIEILRGELAKVFYDATERDVAYMWGDAGVLVRFANDETRGETRFDLLIVADGMDSNTRSLAFGNDAPGVLKTLGQHMAYFTIRAADTDTRWATWYNAAGGRRKARNAAAGPGPGPHGRVPGHLPRHLPQRRLRRLRRARRRGPDADVDALFQDAGGESRDFYMQEVAQVKMPFWSKGRVAVVGDAAYEEPMRPVVGKAQRLFPGAPQVANPQS